MVNYSPLRAPSIGAICGLLLFAACADSSGDDLPDDGFTSSGADTTTTSTSGTSPTTLTTADPTSSTNPTTTATTTMTTTSTTTDTGTTDTGSTDTGSSSSSGDSTSSSDSSSSSSSSSGGDTCGNQAVDADEVCFLGADDTATIAGGNDIAIGDFNGDDDLDVAVVSSTLSQVSVHFGDGTGSIGASNTVSVGSGGGRIIAAELSGDPSDDIVVSNTDDNDVSVLLADGAGDFDPAVDYAVGTGPVDLGFSDFTDDTNIDLLVACPGSSDYYSLVNDGLGAFTIMGPLAPGGNIDPDGIAAGFVGGNSSTADSFYCGGAQWGASDGDGLGSFGGSATGAGGTAVERATGGEFNGDADLDVVCIDPTVDDIVAYVGIAGRDFAATSYDVGGAPSGAAIGDATGEGNADIVVANRGDDTVTVLVGDGAADTAFVNGGTLDVGAGPAGIAIGDLNEDGVDDIAVIAAGDGVVSILLSDP